MNVSEMSEHLTLDEQGIWRSPRSSAVAYPDNGNESCFQLEDSSFWFGHRNDCILAAISRFPPSGPIVDIGGGNGFVTQRLISERFEAILLEPGPAGALNAKTARQVPDVICSSFQDAAFRPESMPAAGLFDVLEHIAEDRLLIQHLHEALKGDGLLYVTVPAHPWLWSLADVDARHYRRYNETTLTDVLSEKFEILYFTYFFRILLLPVMVLRTLPFKAGLAKTKNVVRSETEHGTSGGLAGRIIASLLGREAEKIRNGLRLSPGTSCLLVARKKSSR